MEAVSRDRPVKVRFAPSPTGPLHLGGVRTALFNWFFARQKGGGFVLRIEDTDRERSERGYEAEILDGLNWLGIDWDEGPEAGGGERGECGPYRQSERTEIYKKYLEKLLKEGRAYYCYCTKDELEAERQALLGQGLPPKYSGHCRNLEKPPAGRSPETIRFRIPEARVEFKDIIRGKVGFDASLFGDIVVARNVNSPLYNFAVVVDDHEMKISHVIRGEEHLPNTPKQILMQRALGFDEPEYAHIPLILNPDRSKMSKRFADAALAEYRKHGYLPEALINFLALMGWHPKDNREVFSPKDLTREFDLRRVQKAGAVFNSEKLDWLQKEHLKNLTADEMTERLLPLLREKKIRTTEDFLKKVVQAEKPRLKTLNEFLETAGFFFELPDYGPELLLWQKEAPAQVKSVFSDILKIIRGFEKKNFDRVKFAEALSGIVAEKGRGAVLWPLRAALSGKTASPDPMEIAEILGAAETERRIETAIEKLNNSEQ